MREWGRVQVGSGTESSWLADLSVGLDPNNSDAEGLGRRRGPQDRDQRNLNSPVVVLGSKFSKSF